MGTAHHDAIAVGDAHPPATHGMQTAGWTEQPVIEAVDATQTSPKPEPEIPGTL
jgi:hypothetical protein